METSGRFPKQGNKDPERLRSYDSAESKLTFTLVQKHKVGASAHSLGGCEYETVQVIDEMLEAHQAFLMDEHSLISHKFLAENMAS